MKTTILPDGSAFNTAVIMSKEEAMKLPLKDRPICFRLSSKMYHDVWESIGAASMTFNEAAGNEVFNTEQARKIAVELLFKIANEVEQREQDARQSALDEAANLLVAHSPRKDGELESDFVYRNQALFCKAILSLKQKEPNETTTSLP